MTKINIDKVASLTTAINEIEQLIKMLEETADIVLSFGDIEAYIECVVSRVIKERELIENTRKKEYLLSHPEASWLDLATISNEGLISYVR